MEREQELEKGRRSERAALHATSSGILRSVTRLIHDLNL